jgi:hypothetical protein
MKNSVSSGREDPCLETYKITHVVDFSILAVSNVDYEIEPVNNTIINLPGGYYNEIFA